MDKVIIVLYTIAIVFAILFFFVLIPSIFYNAFQNENIRETFCQENGFQYYEMTENYHEGYCYSINGQATKKAFICVPSPGFLSPIGECKFLVSEDG